jgi:hypothetical protein
MISSYELIINSGCLFLLSAPFLFTVFVLFKYATSIRYKGWFFCTCIFLSYLWVWLVFLVTIVPAHFVSALYWPANIAESQYRSFLLFARFVVLNELPILAAACLGSTWWVARYFLTEWRAEFQDESHE